MITNRNKFVKKVSSILSIVNNVSVQNLFSLGIKSAHFVVHQSSVHLFHGQIAQETLDWAHWISEQQNKRLSGSIKQQCRDISTI